MKNDYFSLELNRNRNGSRLASGTIRITWDIASVELIYREHASRDGQLLVTLCPMEFDSRLLQAIIELLATEEQRLRQGRERFKRAASNLLIAPELNADKD